MTAAVIFLWAGCLWSIARSALCFLLTASFFRRLLALVALALALSCAHRPGERRGGGKNDNSSSCNPTSVVIK